MSVSRSPTLNRNPGANAPGFFLAVCLSVCLGNRGLIGWSARVSCKTFRCVGRQDSASHTSFTSQYSLGLLGRWLLSPSTAANRPLYTTAVTLQHTTFCSSVLPVLLTVNTDYFPQSG
jgi:hypothetical protein